MRVYIYLLQVYKGHYYTTPRGPGIGHESLKIFGGIPYTAHGAQINLTLIFLLFFYTYSRFVRQDIQLGLRRG